MKLFRWTKFLVLLLSGLFFLMASACTTGQAGSEDDKLPITTSSKEAKNYYLEARALGEKLRFKEAEASYKKAIELDPEFALAYLNLSFASTTAKDFFAYLDQARALKDKVSEGERLWIEGAEAGVNGDPTSQREKYKQLAAIYPNDERCLTILGGYYFGQQEYDLAIEQYEKALKINPSFSQPYNQLGYSYRFLGKYDDAERAFKKYIEVIPDDPNPYDSYAELLLKIGKYDQSIENYKKALQVNSQFLNPHMGIASNYNFKGEHAEARKQLDKMYQDAPDDGWRRTALFSMSISYVDEGNMEKAVEMQKKMFSIAQENNDVAAMAGDLVTTSNIMLEFGVTDRAMDHYTKALNMIKESDLDAEQKSLAEQAYQYNVARYALEKKDYSTAKTHLAKYQEQAEGRQNRFQLWNAHMLAGMIALAQKDYDSALTHLEKSNLQNPFNFYRMALAYEGKGDAKKAKEMFDKAANYNAFNNLNQAYVNSKMRGDMAM